MMKSKKVNRYASDREWSKTCVKRAIEGIENYFEINQKHTLTGLLLAIGMSKRSYSDFINGLNEAWPIELKEAIEWARLKIENYYEESLMSRNVTGAIFTLKVHFSWNDHNGTQITNNNNLDVSKLSDEELTLMIEKLSK